MAESFHQSIPEEIANTALHCIGLLLSIAALICMIITCSSSSSSLYLGCALVYGITLIFTYASSTIYHWVRVPKIKFFFKKVDHCAIYLFIAGTCTPYSLILLQDLGVYWIVCLWITAFVGVFLKVFHFGKYPKISLVTYLLMGWSCLLVISPLMNSLETKGILLLSAGGISYTVGVLFYVYDKIKFFHTIWHAFVLGGSTFHYFSVQYFVLHY